MEYDLMHHKKFYDGIWMIVLCVLSLPPLIIAMTNNKYTGLILFMMGVIVGVFPVFIVMQVKKHTVKRLYKKNVEENGMVSFLETTKFINDVESSNGKIYKLCGTYGHIPSGKYKCRFVHNKKYAWVTYIEK